MDKFLKEYSGIFLAVVAYSVAGIVALVRIWQRLSLLEVQMKDAQIDIKECQTLASTLKDNLQRVDSETRLIEERVKNIAAMCENIKQTLEKSTEMRLRQSS